MVAGYREFQTGEVLTASNVNSYLMNQSVMVFADSSARDTALGTAIATGNALVEGMLTYNQDSGKLEIYNGTSWAGVSAVKKIAAFTANGTWTVPAGVTYAIAHMMGGGAGIGDGTTGSNGGDSSVAFASGTVVGKGQGRPTTAGTIAGAVPGVDGIGQSAQGRRQSNTNDFWGGATPSNVFVVAGADVTPAASITVTVGAGGAAGTNGAAGGSGYVYIEYYE